MDRLFFYSKSADKKPGHGANESVQDPQKYRVLSLIPHWRRTLSNFHVDPFVFEGKTYNSIEHVFQSKKIALVDPEKADFFTMESGHPIGQGDGALAQKNRKLVLLGKEHLQKWSQISGRVMEEAARAKFLQCTKAMVVLLATQDAELWHVVPRKKPVRFEHLEKIREE